MRERRRSFSARRRDGGRVVPEDEVETFCFGPLRRVRDLLGLEQDQDLCVLTFTQSTRRRPDFHAIDATSSR